MWKRRQLVPNTREFSFSTVFYKKTTKTGGTHLNLGIAERMPEWAYIGYEYKPERDSEYTLCN